MDKQVNNLQGVKVGDKFIKVTRLGWSGSYEKVVVCESATPKQCTIDGVKYRKENATALGGYNPYHSNALLNYSEELEAKGKATLRLEHIKSKIDDIKSSDLTAGQCEAIYSILKQEQTK